MRFALTLKYLASLFVFALLCALSPRDYIIAQNSQEGVYQSQTVLRANTRLVVVDVVATDNKGQPVKDLRSQDFAVLENGTQQKISDFTFHHPGEAEVLPPPRLAPNVVSNAPQFKSGSLNVILFDSVNGDLTAHAYAQDQLVKFLGSGQLAQPLAIFALQSQVKLLHDFTTDGAALKESVQHYKPPVQSNQTESVESRASAFSNEGNYHTNERDIETTLNQLNVLAKILKGYPGRKNLIWLSESFPLSLFPETTLRSSMSAQDLPSAEAVVGSSTFEILQKSAPFTSYAALVRKVADALMDAQVAVYPVDAGALGRDSHLAAQHTMNDVAAWTGGEAFINRNDLAVSMRTSIDDGSTYYTLEYYPSNKKWDGEFRSIRVKTDRPGVKLRYRLGYYAVDPEKENKDETDKLAETVSRAMEFDTPSYTAVRFQAGVLPPSEKNKKVVVNFAIDPHTVSFEHSSDGLEHAKVGCVVWAYGKDKEKPTMAKEVMQNAGLKPDVYKQLMSQYFPCKQEIDLKPGTYTLRLAVIDRTTNQIGTANAPITVP
ncbi:MAG TPA: VWA domain-containing protein [Candidatus Angelobacter sp.]|nr:VWA domain-containing protein [Candidatus Angelobacter sp.]